MNFLITGAWREAKKYIDKIENLGHEVRFIPCEKDKIPVAYEWVEGVICNGLLFYHPISLFPNLRYIQLISAGYDRVDMDEIVRRKIVIHNARGVYSTPMAEYAVAKVLFLYKRVLEFREQQERREWKKIREIRELAGKRVLIIGCGDVGQECARRFKAFGTKVIGVNRTLREIEWFDQVVGLESLDKELELADVVIVCIGLSDETRGLVKARKIRQDGILVNISRGGTVELEGAVCNLILDVFDTEPLEKNDPLWYRATVTPHNSFVSEGNGDRLWKVIKENLRG